MSPFEYVIVMISIILGLGITTILTGVAEMIKRTPLTSLFAPYIIWIALIFLLHIHEWFLSYELKAVQVWTLHKFVFFLLYPINLYILAHLLFPTGPQRDSTSREFYFNNYPKLYIGAIILVIQSIVHNLTISSHPIHTQVPHLIALVILSTMVTTKTKNVAIHVAVSILLLAVALVSLVVENRKVY
jgi:hypothetical protein